MKSVRFIDSTGEIRIGSLSDERIIRDAGPANADGFVPTSDAWSQLAAANGPEYRFEDVQVLHPVVPRKIVAVGLNYRSHAEESQLAIPSVPVIFAKFPSSLIGHEESIVIPREETRPDFEGEVAVIIGKRVYRADREAARSAVGGIAALNDVSGRRAQLETPLRQFTLGKSFDTFAPLGPCIRSAEDLDLSNLRLRTTVSGEVMQEASAMAASRHDIFARATSSRFGLNMLEPCEIQW